MRFGLEAGHAEKGWGKKKKKTMKKYWKESKCC